MRCNSTLNLKTDSEITLQVEQTEQSTDDKVCKLKFPNTRIPVFGTEKQAKPVEPVVCDIWKSKGRRLSKQSAAIAAEEPQSSLNTSPDVERLDSVVNTRRNTNFNNEAVDESICEDSFVMESSSGIRI